ncbi:MAG: hypothetical protein LW865_02125 [Betaproteobacteria bacterium]|jgi:hypothetical protein|nr:hypothetical protein [Betaproteobacteria bacterium]
MDIPNDKYLATATDTELANCKKCHEAALGIVFNAYERCLHRKTIALINDELSARAQIAKARKAGALLSKVRQVTSTVAFG